MLCYESQDHICFLYCCSPIIYPKVESSNAKIKLDQGFKPVWNIDATFLGILDQCDELEQFLLDISWGF